MSAATAAGASPAGAAVAAATTATVLANDQQLHPPAQPWDFGGYLDTFDASSVRRGHQVYTQVCASCHGLSRIAYRNLVGVCYSEAEVRTLLPPAVAAGDPLHCAARQRQLCCLR